MGFPAYIFERLLSLGIDLSTFNTGRFIQAIQEKAQDDPWSLNAELIMYNLAVKNFRKTDIKKRPCLDIEISVESGSWFLESPFSQIFESDENNIIYLQGVTQGFHRLFRNGTIDFLDFYITADECIVITP